MTMHQFYLYIGLWALCGFVGACFLAWDHSMYQNVTLADFIKMLVVVPLGPFTIFAVFLGWLIDKVDSVVIFKKRKG
jgi:hypothetical protein